MIAEALEDQAASASIGENCKVQLIETRGVCNDVYLGDSSATRREPEYDQETATRGNDEAHSPVDQRRLPESGALRKSKRLLGDGHRPAHFPGRAVGSENDVWVEHRDQSIEVASREAARNA